MSDFRPCRECRDWKHCLLTDNEKHWFGYQHIRFCKHHVFFLLKYEDDIRSRAWPTDDEALGGSGTRTLTDAAWVKVSLLLAELDERLSKTGLKGKLLSSECKQLDRKIEYLSKEARDALYYISGDNRKNTSFTDWLRMRRFRYEKRNIAKVRA